MEVEGPGTKRLTEKKSLYVVYHCYISKYSSVCF